jgi:hypothetical protein
MTAGGVVYGNTLIAIIDEALVTDRRSGDTFVTEVDRSSLAAWTGSGDAGTVAGQAAGRAVGPAGRHTPVAVEDTAWRAGGQVGGDTVLVVEVIAYYTLGRVHDTVGAVKAGFELTGGVNAHTVIPFDLCAFGAGGVFSRDIVGTLELVANRTLGTLGRGTQGAIASISWRTLGWLT